MRSISLGEPSARQLSVLLSLAALAGGCAHDAVLAFHVDPPLACANQAVAITWQVRGRAQLRADPSPPGWKEDVPSVGSLPAVPVAKDTTFTVVAPDANPARGASYASQTAYVTSPTDNRAALVTCDAAGSCSGTLTIHAEKSVRVSQIMDPTWKSGLKVIHREVCVTPPGGSRMCLAPEASATLGAPADGVWTFDAQLAKNETAAPPSQLRVVFDFGCK